MSWYKIIFYDELKLTALLSGGINLDIEAKKPRLLDTVISLKMFSVIIS